MKNLKGVLFSIFHSVQIPRLFLSHDLCNIPLVWALPFFLLVASAWVAQMGASHSRQKEEEVAQKHQQDREALENEEEQAREVLGH